jgi:predicted transcriptional regulator YdeE
MESKGNSGLIQPKIVNREAFNIVGMLVHGDPKTIDYSKVWNEFNKLHDQIISFCKDKAYYNVYFETDDNMVDLIAGMAVADPNMMKQNIQSQSFDFSIFNLIAGTALTNPSVPYKQLVVRNVPAGCYAVFGCLIGSANLIYEYIDNRWISSSKYEYDDRPSFEYFAPKTINPHSMLIHIPIKERK